LDRKPTEKTQTKVQHKPIEEML